MRKRRLLLIVVLAGGAGLAAFLALLLRPSGEAAQSQVRDGHVTLAAAHKRKELPDLIGATVTPPPSHLALRSLRGKPAFIDVWASWCAPCRDEAPVLARLWRRYRGRVQFLGIDVEDHRSDARAWVRRFRLGYPSIFDRAATMAGRLGFYGLPTAFLVDGQGRIAAHLIGKQREATLRSGLEALAREAQGGR